MERPLIFIYWENWINILKIDILLKAVYRFENPYQNTNDLFHRNRKHKPKNVCGTTRLWVSKAILTKKNKPESGTLSDFKVYCKTVVTKTAWFCHKSRYAQQCHRIKNPEINSESVWQFLRISKNTLWGKDSFFYKFCGGKRKSTYRRIKIDPHFSPHVEIKSKWMKKLNEKLGNMKLSVLEESIRNSIHDIVLGKDIFA